MLAELERIVASATGASRETIDDDLRAMARALLERQFLFSDDFQGRRRYETIRRHKIYFSDLFDALGFDLFVDEQEQCVGILSQAGAATKRMSLNESLFLMALRLVYEERVQSFDMKEGGRCDTTLAEVWTLVEEQAKRERPSAARCRAIAEAFARNGIVKLGDTLPNGDMALEIRPVIARAASAESARGLENYAIEGGMNAKAASEDEA